MANDTVARFDLAYLRANFEHRGTRLVAEQVGKITVRSFDTIDFAELGAADPAGMDFHEHLAVTQRWQLNLLDDQGLALFDQNSGAGFHLVVSWN
jgi:hypothetical protein